MYKNILKTEPLEQCTYVPLDEYLRSQQPKHQPQKRESAFEEAHFLNTSQFVDFFRVVKETANMHGYMETSTFESFLWMVSACITVSESPESDNEMSDG